MYGFGKGSGRLVRIQVMSMLPGPEAVGPHLTAMLETYGRPTGAYNCPDTGGVPTRRFTWRRAQTALADIFLVYGDRVSVTLDIAPAGGRGASLSSASSSGSSRRRRWIRCSRRRRSRGAEGASAGVPQDRRRHYHRRPCEPPS